MATSGFYYDPKDAQDKQLKQSLEVIAKREHRTISDTMKLMLWATIEACHKNSQVMPALNPPQGNPFQKFVPVTKTRARATAR